MAISTYAELKTAIASWLDRSDLTDVIPDFIVLAETRHKRDFKIRRMETRVTANTIANTEYYSLPDNYVAMRNIKLNTDTKTPLEFLTPEIMDRLQAGSSVGCPKAYSIKGHHRTKTKIDCYAFLDTLTCRSSQSVFVLFFFRSL